MQLIMFSKMLGEFDIARAGDIIKDLGFEGVDLTCRSGGHVLPENVVKDLPTAVKTLRDKGLDVPMLTTEILSADEPHTENIFRMAAECGVPHLKLGYHRYIGFGTLRDVMDDTRMKLRGLSRLAKTYGVSANMHMHSDTFIGALGPIVYMLIAEFCPAQIGAYVDPGHMFNEGGLAGWQMSLDILAGRVNLVAAKSMGWERTDHPDGTATWKNRMYPIYQGMVQWKKVFQCLKAMGYDGPVSLHSEYQGSHSWKDLTTQELIEQTRKDLQYIRGVVNEVYGA